MKAFCIILLGMRFSLQLAAREVDLRLWVSGGTQGLVLGSRDCPGWLSVARQLEQEDPEACWVHLGAPPLPDFHRELQGLKFPNILVPGEADFRLQELASFADPKLPFTLLNVDMLPQFPDETVPFSERGIWKQADGVEIHVFGLLSKQAPLRIPADRFRPLQVRDPLGEMRALLTDQPNSASVFPVLVLPEDAEGAEWSTRFPEIPVLILPPGGQSKVIEVQEGKQLRVQPAKFGRSLIRVQIYWDTVTRTFRNPTAEVVWVNAPDLQGLDLPDRIKNRLHPVSEPPENHLGVALLRKADGVLLPKMKSLKFASKLPDAVRVSAVPEDDAWLRVQVPASVWRQWRQVPETIFFERENLGDEVEVLVSAKLVAGNGDWHSVIRQDLLTHDFHGEWMSFTSRDLILPLEERP
ncbi:hypothetical protein P0Y35_05270 [Kiritimatiellaeota bacterium B1221]|nr:hypothetical protein [Kiritimatiellaeota bacterium B1221]